MLLKELLVTLEGEVEAVAFPVTVLVVRKLKNLEISKNLVLAFYILLLLNVFIHVMWTNLFSDVPSCTSLIEHDVCVGDYLPIKQHV